MSSSLVTVAWCPLGRRARVLTMARRSRVPPCPSNDTVTGRGGLFQAGVAPAGGSGAFGCLHFSALRGSQFLRNSIQTTLGLWCLRIFSLLVPVMGICCFAFGDCYSTEISVDRSVEVRMLSVSQLWGVNCGSSIALRVTSVSEFDVSHQRGI
ncbi:uncharacterized protein LAESUDRAFT_160492 [Laetiporus sulphureus 93-53]|uniref:Uncharacterized protein n=1 Tax=Laetiporus sulphureus 93-53 TaxID=1314785 RepID=A0A165HNA5_9APHY|nr:uncharacterized protein LAESUDRAFT_160492 [Laetiporus sulphureus 93-53]KZT11961.1 hypothetical protein LAESUDRAFT_160492 [Laetiporus sulphureus 93-53]